MDIEIRCIRCNAKMECVFNVKQVDNTTMSKIKLAKFVGGIYKCPHCGKTIELHLKGR